MRKSLYISFLAAFLCVLFALGNPIAVYSTESYSPAAINKGVEYFAAIQNDDGGFASDKGRASSKVTTAWVIMALKAAGENISSDKWTKTGNTPLDYLQKGSDSPDATTDYARVLLALSAGGGGSKYKGVNLAEKIISFQQANGQFAQIDKSEQELINAHMWSILALASAGYEIPKKDKAIEWLRNCQNMDGGFGWAIGLESDPDDTGIAVTALVLLGENPANSAVIKKALDYFEKQKDYDGGYAWTGQKKNSATDAWVIQGLIAAGADPGDTFKHLLGFQNSDGSFNWTKELKSSPALMTSYAIMALSKKPLPVNFDFNSIADSRLKISLTIGSTTALVNNKTNRLDVSPVIVNNRTMVPLRFIGECLGASFRWIPESSSIKITYNGQEFDLLIGKPTAELDTPAIITGGRTLVPLRYISEKLGAKVTWIEKERRIEIER